MSGTIRKVVEEKNCSDGASITIDLSYERSEESGPYCCNACRDKKVSIERKDVSVNQSDTITYYQHSITKGTVTKIKYYTKEGQSVKNITAPGVLNFPITGPVDVYAFHCNENPVLIYVEKNEPETINKWFQIDTPDNGQWSQVRDKLDGVTPNVGTDCDKFKRLTAVLNLLQCLEKDCTPTSSYSSSGNHGLQVASGVEGSGTSQDVIIKLDNKPSDGGSTQYPGYEIGTVSIGKTIKVKKSDVADSEFIKYIHTEQNDSPFKLLKVQDSNILVCEPKILGDVTSVLAYYWKHKAGNNDKALLVEIERSGNKHTYYANSSSGWSEYIPSEYESGNKLSDDQLKHKLTLLNCEINDVVQIDVQQTTEYCHISTDGTTPHTHKRIQVQEVSNSGKELVNYKAYEHIPNVNASGGTIQNFHISGFTKNGTAISLPLTQGLPVMNATKVIVFMCENRSSEKTPLLIYIDAPTLKTPNKQWFQSTDKGWQVVENGSLGPTSYTQILDILDGLTSDCAPPEVTIKINEREGSYLGGSVPNKNIEVKKNDKLQNVPGFTEYTHKVEKWECYFNVSGFQYNSHDIKGDLKGTKRVMSVSVYYWTALENSIWRTKSNPLLIKIEKHGSSNPEWFWNLGKNKQNTQWKEIDSPTYLADYKKLKSKLTLLNCKLNNVTVIDIGKRRGDKYCHQRDNSVKEYTHNPLIQVTEDSTYKGRLGSFVLYKHGLSEEAKSKPLPLDKKFHISGFKNGSTGITLNEPPPSLPFLYVSKCLVFWCSSEPNGSPLLVHFKHSTTPSDETEKDEWYKKDGKSWIKLEVGNGRPTDASDIRAINKILNSYETKCKDKTMIYILSGVPATLGAGGIGYGVWYWYTFLRGPWLRLM